MRGRSPPLPPALKMRMLRCAGTRWGAAPPLAHEVPSAGPAPSEALTWRLAAPPCAAATSPPSTDRRQFRILACNQPCKLCNINAHLFEQWPCNPIGLVQHGREQMQRNDFWIASARSTPTTRGEGNRLRSIWQIIHMGWRPHIWTYLSFLPDFLWICHYYNCCFIFKFWAPVRSDFFHTERMRGFPGATHDGTRRFFFLRPQPS